MTRFALLAVMLVGCVDGAKTDYGMPTETTKIDVAEDGGFAPPGTSGREVHILGGDVSFVNGSVSGVGFIDADHAQQVIDALANVHFMTLAGDFTQCMGAATDAPTATFSANLDDAGANTVRYYTGCSGGEFDLLRQLETKIFDASGFTAWSSTR